MKGRQMTETQKKLQDSIAVTDKLLNRTTEAEYRTGDRTRLLNQISIMEGVKANNVMLEQLTKVQPAVV